MKIFLYILLTAAIILGLKWLVFPSNNQSVNKTGNQPQAMPVDVVVLKGQSFSQPFYLSGILMPDEETLLMSESAGKITSLQFPEGKKVTKGTLIAKLNDADLQAQKKKLESQLDLSRKKQVRLQELIQIKGTSEESQDVLNSEIDGIEADLDLVKAQLAKTEIRAPFDGVLGLRMVSVGATITNQTSIGKIIKTSPLKIEFNVPERLANQVKAGAIIQFKIEQNNVLYEAKVYAMEPSIDNNVRSLKVRALFENKDENIKPGSTAYLTLATFENEQGLVIPSNAVTTVRNGFNVFVIKNGKAEIKNIEISTRTENDILVNKGLQIGDSVIVSGIMTLKSGASVKVKKIIQ